MKNMNKHLEEGVGAYFRMKPEWHAKDLAINSALIDSCRCSCGCKDVNNDPHGSLCHNCKAGDC